MGNKKKVGLVAAQVKEAASAISPQKMKAVEKKKESGLAVQKGKAPVKVVQETKQIVILSDDDDVKEVEVKEEDSSSDEEYGEEGDIVEKDSADVEEEEEEEDTSDEDYDEEGDSMDKDSDGDSEYEKEEPLVPRQPAPVMAEKKKEAGVAMQKGKTAVKVAPETKQIVILSDDDVKEEGDSSMDKDNDDVKVEDEEDSSSDEDYDEEGDIMDKDSDGDSVYEKEELVARQPAPAMAEAVADEEKLAVHEQQPLQQQVEEPAVVEEEDDGDRSIVKVRKFEGSIMLAEVDRTDDNGVASRTGRRKVRKLHNSQLGDPGKDSKGTFSDPIDL